MHAVLGLIEDLGLRTLEDLVLDFHLGDAELRRDLGTGGGVRIVEAGQAVQEDGGRIGQGHELLGDAVGLELLDALGPDLVGLAHGDPHVGVDDVGTRAGGLRIGGEGDGAAVGLGDGLASLDDVVGRHALLRTAGHEVHAELSAHDHEGGEDISHQIKTPITSMQINEELLLNQPLNKKQFEKISNIHSQTLKINELIVALLRLAKVESNSIDYDFKDYYLYEIIDNVENVLTPLLLENNVKINFTNDSIQIKCDFIWLSEAIENIIKNCIEINPNDIIDIYCEENDFQKKIFIHDHGNGFDIKDLEHLFERFYTSKNSKGFGIGLALTNEIIKGHYGTIEAENDDGALFIITLPKILAKKKY